jgi:predicted RNA-binding protein with RPS1 domain
VRIITADPKEGKLIFSEKSGEEETEKTNLIDKYQVGDIVEGEVTGAVDFGVFVKLEQGLEGLVHISELDWGLVEDPRTLYTVGDRVQVKVIEIKDGKVSLSIKALKENPWKHAAETYKKGQEVQASSSSTTSMARSHPSRKVLPVSCTSASSVPAGIARDARAWQDVSVHHHALRTEGPAHDAFVHGREEGKK